MKIMTVGRNVVIPKEFHEEIRKISQETGDTMRTVTARILARAKEKSLFDPTITTKTKESKPVNFGNIPEDNGDPSDEIHKTPEEIKKHEQEEEKENIGKGKDKPIPENKEKKMLQEEDMQAVKQVVNSVKEGFDTRLSNQEKAYEQGIENLAKKIDTLIASPGTEIVKDKAPSLTAQDVDRMLDKRDTRRAETEAARLRKSEQVQKTKEANDRRKQNEVRLEKLECSLNPEKPECQVLMKLLGTEVAKIVNPEKKKDDDGKGGETPKEPKTSEQAIADVINRLKLSGMKKEVREKMKPEEIEERTTNVAKLVEQLNVTPVDMFNVLKRHPDDKKGIAIFVAGDTDLAEEVLKRADVKAKLEGCNLGDEEQCKLADKVLRESGLALARKAEKGNRYYFVDQKLDKGTGF